jgi:hypothetical protein
VFDCEDLLRKAGDAKDPAMRIGYLSAFFTAQYCGTENRTSKPFNPILGETFEMQGEGWKYISEQVSHHPPVTAAYAESNNYEFWMNTAMQQSFKMTYLKFKTLGTQNVRFKDNNDHFVIVRPITFCYGIVVGKMYIDHVGEMEIHNVRTGESVKLNFKS